MKSKTPLWRMRIAGIVAVALLALIVLPFPVFAGEQTARPAVTAHTGSFNTEDNSLENFQRAAAFPGVDIVEADLRFFDGVPMFAHGKKLPADPVTLEQLFALVSDTERSINLDLKDARGDLTRVLPLAQAYGLEGRVFLTGIYPHLLPAAKRIGLPYYHESIPLLGFFPWANRVSCAVAKWVGAVGLNLPYILCTEDLVKTAHANGLLVSVWTVDKEADLRRMIAMGVDNITTRYPEKLIALLEENA